MAPSIKPSQGAPHNDPRFSTFQTDPRYRLPRKKDTHVKVDKRFASMLEDDDFSSKAKVDRYGRKTGTSTSSKGRKQLEKLYDFEVDEKEDNDSASEVDDDDDETIAKELERVNNTPALDSKYVGYDESSSSEEDESSSEEEESEEEDAAAVAGLEGYGGEEDDDIPMGEVTRRLAVVNLDWDHIRAVDLMAVSQSFCPAGGKVENVAVYPSEFGRERMEKEEFEGPPKELFAPKKSKSASKINEEPRSTKRNKELFRDSGSEEGSDPEEESDVEEDDDPEVDASEEEHEGSEDDEQDEGDLGSEEDLDDEEIQESLLKHAANPQSEFDTKALRAYQLSRLRYYYAVITCSTPDTAHALYDSMDGREYLSTANFFDLRFVPDETTFDDKPRDSCASVPSGYRPAEFVTEALTHSNVRLTWDEEDQGRKEAQKRAFTKDKDGKNDIDEDDLRAYIGSDSSEDEGSEDDIEVVDATQLLQGTASEPAPSAGPKASKESKAELARQKMRLALGLSLDEPKPSKKEAKSKTADGPQVGNMQITFSSALASAKPKDTAKTSIFENTPDDVKEETTKERYVRKERERKARRKEKMKAGREGSLEPAIDAPISKSAKKDTKAAAEPAAEDDEDPFNDPFFEDPKAANATARAQAKKAKRDAKVAAKALEAERKEREKKELELLMVEDGFGVGGGAEFDMDEIRRAEKDAKRRGKKGKKGKDAKEGEAPKQEFEIDVADPRFKSVYEDFEYAIDPSNPRFSGTQGMKKLLEEGRRKRKGGEEDEREERAVSGGKKRRMQK